MARQSFLTLNAQLKRMLAASFLTLALLGGAAAFAVGFTGALETSLSDTSSQTSLQIEALQGLDDSLGPQGFLEAYRVFLLNGDKDTGSALSRFADAANTDISRFRAAAASQRDRDEAATLTSLATPLRRTALFAAGGQTEALLPFVEVERDYGSLKTETAKAARGVDADRLNRLMQALVWTQAAMVGSLSLLAIVLFAMAWYLRDRLIAPLSILRRSVVSAAAGAVKEPLWGIDRKDEIGALARAADRLRSTAGARVENVENKRLDDVTERLAQGANRLERDLARITYATAQTRSRIEQASTRAALASQAAIEAAGLARQGAKRFAEDSQEKLATAGNQARTATSALLQAAGRLSDAATRLELKKANEITLPLDHETAQLPHPVNGEAAVVLDSLVSGLDALERFARERETIAGDQAIALTTALIEAVDRLHAVADRVSASADPSAIRAAE